MFTQRSATLCDPHRQVQHSRNQRAIARNRGCVTWLTVRPQGPVSEFVKNAVIAGVVTAAGILVEPSIWEMLDPNARTLFVAPGAGHIWLALIGVPAGIGAIYLAAAQLRSAPNHHIRVRPTHRHAGPAARVRRAARENR